MGLSEGFKKTRSGRVVFLSEKKVFLIRKKLYRTKSNFARSINNTSPASGRRPRYLDQERLFC